MIANTEWVATEATDNVTERDGLMHDDVGVLMITGGSDSDGVIKGALDMSISKMVAASYWFSHRKTVEIHLTHFAKVLKILNQNSIKWRCKDNGMFHCVLFNVKLVFWRREK